MSQTATDQPPVEWVYLRNPNSNVSDEKQADGFCSFIKRFYWRSRDEQPNELHMEFNGNGEKRYKYYDVSREVYNEAWRRAHNPGDYEKNFGSWFSNNIEDNYEYERYKG